MDQYSPAELSDLFLQAMALNDTQFQYWITITFAVVVAGFVAGERLTRKLRYAVVVLYLLATLTLGLRVLNAGTPAFAIAEALEESGALIFPVIGWEVIVSRVLYVGFGTILAVYFLLASNKPQQADR